MSNHKAALALAATATMGLALVGCGSSTDSAASIAASSSAPSAVATASAVPEAASSAASPAASGDAVTTWCDQYNAIANTLANLTSSQQDAQAALDAIPSFDALWVQAVDSGYVSADEGAANQRASASFTGIVTLLAGGAAGDSPEVAKAQADLKAVIAKDDALLQSTDAKVAALCAGPSAVPNASASPASS